MQKGLVRKEHYAYQKNGSCTFFVAIEPCDTVFARQPIAAIPQFAELNIGHYLIGEAIFIGLEESVRKMRTLMDLAR